MEFTLDETQQAVADLAGEVLGRHTPAPSDKGHEAAWKAMAQAGLLGLALPRSLDGDGLGVLSTGLVLAAVGRHATAVPALATLALGVLPVVAAGSAEQQRNLLPPVAAGDRLLTAAPNEPGDPLPAVPRTTATRDGDELVVNGTKVGVAHAADAYRILVPVRLADGTAVLLVDPSAEGVHLDRTPTAGATPEYRLRLDAVRAPRSDLLPGADAVDRLNALAVAGACALGEGALAGALDLTAAHVGSREQFGRPLAAFQAVAQQIADVYVAARTMQLAARSASWRLDTGRDAAGDLAVAGYWLAEELPTAMHTCHHLHGGLGMDVTYPMHRYYGLAKDLVRFVGGAQDRLGRLGALVAEGS